MHSLLTYLGEPWPHPAASKAFVRNLQLSDGLWSLPWDSNVGVCMNFDGLYHLSRPCREAPCSESTIGHIREACLTYVDVAHQTLKALNTTKDAFDLGLHYFPVVISTVAE